MNSRFAPLSPAARVRFERELSHLTRTPNSGTNPVIYYRAWRDHNMGKARLCASDAGRQTWIDLAREQNRKLVAAKKYQRLRAQTEAWLGRLLNDDRLTVRQAS